MKSKQIALCGLLCALAVTLLLLGGVIPIATFCAPLLAMVILLPILEEYGPRTAAAAYGAAAILALLLVWCAILIAADLWAGKRRKKQAQIAAVAAACGGDCSQCSGCGGT